LARFPAPARPHAGLDGRRRRIRRGGSASRKAAAAVLARLRVPRPGDAVGRMLTVGDWLVFRTSPAASTVRGHVRGAAGCALQC
jgi:hypothetical protein